MNKNKKGFTLVEILSVIILLVIIGTIAVLNLSPTYEDGKKKSLIDEAFVMSQGGVNKYGDDRINKTYSGDVFANKNANKRCYLVKSLIGPYVTKDSTTYNGSIEICTAESCTYKTKIWLTDGEYYINGKIVDDTLSLDDIDTSKTDENFISCGVDTTNISSEWLFDYTGTEEMLVIPEDGTYALEAWGAQGGNAFGYHRGGFDANSYPEYMVGGKGGYSYTEMDLKKGDSLYINVGGKGRFLTYDLDTIANGGYNGGGKANYNSAAGGGATSIALKSGILSGLTSDEVILVAGGGGGAQTNCWYDDCTSRDGGNGGGFCESSWNGICLNNSTIRSNTGLGAGGGFYVSGGAPLTYQFHANNWGGVTWYNSVPENILYPAFRGGTGYINSDYTKNGVMYVLDYQTNLSGQYSTYRTENYSEEPIAQYAKEGNGFARITKMSSSTP